MNIKRFSLSFLIPILFLLRVEADLVTLTDKQGRDIQAEIVSIIGANITIKMANGRQFTFPLANLNEASHKTIEQWKLVRVGDKREPFKISINTFTEGKQESSTTSTKTKVYQAGYTVKIQNNTPLSLPSLTVEYLILKEDAIVAAKGSQDALKDTLKGTSTLDPLKIRETFSFNTDTLEMRESKLKSGWSYIGGGKDNAVDELTGIWLKIKTGDQVIYEYSRPSNLPDRITWK